VLTNFFIGGGYGMLHASCLFRDGRALLLVAPHNAGKSTTALRLALAGYRLVSDSMIFVPPDGTRLHLLGFPVGRIKLRRDMVAAFPQVTPFLAPEPVGGEIKYSLDLRRLNAALVCTDAVAPGAVDLCLLARGADEQTRLLPVAESTLWEALMYNSLYYDTEAIWQRNLAQIERLVAHAAWHHLVIGSDPEQLVAALDTLWRTQ
jgi:hypothetical protein